MDDNKMDGGDFIIRPTRSKANIHYNKKAGLVNIIDIVYFQFSVTDLV